MKLNGTPKSIMRHFETAKLVEALDLAEATIQHGKRKQQIERYQAAALYKLAGQYNRPDACILEIGTYYGYSAAVIALAAPQAIFLTLNPREWEVADARRNLAHFINVNVIQDHSWDYLKNYPPPDLDLIFIDGDHKRVKLDLPWWNYVTLGGLMLFHDYSPLGSRRHCPPVFEAVNEFANWLGREPDVSIIDSGRVGMAGFYKHKGDPIWEARDG